MTHDAKLPDEQGKAPREFVYFYNRGEDIVGRREEFKSQMSFDAWLRASERMFPLATRYDLIDRRDYDQLEARCKGLEGERDELKRTLEMVPGIWECIKQRADQAALIEKLTKALEFYAKGGHYYGRECVEFGTGAEEALELARARHGDLRGE